MRPWYRGRRTNRLLYDHLNGSGTRTASARLRKTLATKTDTVGGRIGIAERTLTRCKQLVDRYTELNDALSASKIQTLSSQRVDRDMTERKLRDARNQLTNQEDVISNIVHIIDVGIGQL